MIIEKSEFKRVFNKSDSEVEETFPNFLNAHPYVLSRMLFHVMRFNSFPLVKLLIELGADVNSSHVDGITPLHYACQEGQLEVAEYLVTSGAHVSALCDKGFSILIHAVKSRSLPMVSWALEQGCDINQSTLGGFNVIHAAVALPETEKESETCAIIEFLFNRGATISNTPVCPISLARTNGLMRAAMILQTLYP